MIDHRYTLAVLQAYSLRDLIDQVNKNNADPANTKILKDDIVQIIRMEDTFFLLYYK